MHDVEMMSPTRARSWIGSTVDIRQVASTAAESLLWDLDERNLDLLILRKFGPFEERLNFEVLCDHPNFVAAGASNPWTRRRRIELSELMNELWVLPPAGTQFGTTVSVGSAGGR